MKTTKNIQQIFSVNRHISILWAGGFVMLLVILFNWDFANIYSGSFWRKANNGYTVDDLLLTSGELDLGSNTSLVNFNLVQKDETYNTTDLNKVTVDKDVTYKKILQQKIEKVRKTSPVDDGVRFKPIP